MHLPVPPCARHLLRLLLLTASLALGASAQGQAGSQSAGERTDQDAHVAARGLDWLDNYQPGGVEQLVAEGRGFLQDRDYPRAEQAFARALHVGRVSNGLFSPALDPLVELLLESLLGQGKWQEFDRHLEYLAWLHERTLGVDPESLVAGLLRQSDWYRRAAAALDDNRSTWYLVQGKFLSWQAVSVLEAALGPEDLRLVPVLYRIVLDHYYQSASIQRQGMSSFEFKTDAKVIANGWSLSKNETVSRSYRIGRENLERIRKILAVRGVNPALSDALLGIQLADWELLHGGTGRAFEGYQDAYWQLLRAGIAPAEVDDFFDRLVVLPEQEVMLDWQPPVRHDNEAPLRVRGWSVIYPGVQVPPGLESGRQFRPPGGLPEYATVQMVFGLNGAETDAAGRPGYLVTGLNVLDYEPRDETLLQRAFREIPALAFRPRFSAGRPLARDMITLVYEFPQGQD